MKILKISAKEKKSPPAYSTWLGNEINRITNHWRKKNPYGEEELEIIVEWLHNVKPQLTDLTIENAYNLAAEWDKEQKIKEDIKNYKTNDVVYKFKDGWKFVKLSYEDVPSEKSLVEDQDGAIIGALNETQYGGNQSIGENTYSSRITVEEMMNDGKYVIYSLRDKRNYPHATVEVSVDGKNIEILQIYSSKPLTDVKKSEYWTDHFHPQLEKIKEFINYLKTSGFQMTSLATDIEVKVGDLDEAETNNEYGIPLYIRGIGGDADDYFENLKDAYGEGGSGSYWHKGSAIKAAAALLNYAVERGQLKEFEAGFERFQDQTWEWWIEAKDYIEFENPRPDEDDLPNKDNFIIPPDVQENQAEFKGMPEAKPRFDEEAYNKALKEYNDAEEAYEKELESHEEYFEPYQFTSYIYDELKKIKPKDNKEPNSEEKVMAKSMKMRKFAIKDEDIPKADVLATYIQALTAYMNDTPKIDDKLAGLIKKLPSERQVEKEYSNEECKILFETISYLWKKITGKDIIKESKVVKSPESLSGNYWLIKNGILLHGINHYGIIKSNIGILTTLLNLNGFALQQYLSGEPNKLLRYIIENGGIRIFINKNKKAYFQMSQETYGKWGKSKVKKYDFKSKVVKIIDFKAKYSGWKSGVSIKL